MFSPRRQSPFDEIHEILSVWLGYFIDILQVANVGFGLVYFFQVMQRQVISFLNDQLQRFNEVKLERAMIGNNIGAPLFFETPIKRESFNPHEVIDSSFVFITL